MKNQLLNNHVFDSNVLGREELELWHEINSGSRSKSPIELLADQLLPYNQTSSACLFGNHTIKDSVAIINNTVVLYAPLKRSHIGQLNKDHPMALKLAVQRNLMSHISEDLKTSLVVVNLSYDPKRRPNESLYQEIDMELYANQEITNKIIDHLSFIGYREPLKCTKLDWYKDGNRNRRIKCELCPFRSECKQFDAKHNSMKNILNF